MKKGQRRRGRRAAAGVGHDDDDDEESETVDASSASASSSSTTTSNRSPESNNASIPSSSSSSSRSPSKSSTSSSSSSSQQQPSEPSSSSSKVGKEEKQPSSSPGKSTSSTSSSSSNVSVGASGNSSNTTTTSSSSSSSNSSSSNMTTSQPTALRSAMGRTRSMRMRQQQQQQTTNQKADTNTSGSTAASGASPAATNSRSSSSLETDTTTSSSSASKEQRRVRFQLNNTNSNSNESTRNRNSSTANDEKKNAKASGKQGKRQSQGDDDDKEEEESSMATATSSFSSSTSTSSSLSKKLYLSKTTTTTRTASKHNDDEEQVAATLSRNKNTDKNAMQPPPPKRLVKARSVASSSASSSNMNGDKNDSELDVNDKAMKKKSRPPKALFSTSSSSTAAAEGAVPKPQQQQRSVVAKVMDIDAANNASRNQMLEDEVYDLCDSIRSSLSNSASHNNATNSEAAMSCLEAAVDLALIMSVRQQRQVLFRKHFQMVHVGKSTRKTTLLSLSASPLGKDWGSVGSNTSTSSPSPSRRRGGCKRNGDDPMLDEEEEEDDENDEASPLGAVLDLLAWMTTRSTLTEADMEEEEEEDHENDHADHDPGKGADTAAAVVSTLRTRTSRSSQEDRGGGSAAEATAFLKDNERKKTNAAAAARQVPIVWHVMSMIVHFLSLDCTLQSSDIETLGIAISINASHACSQRPTMASSSSSLLASPSSKKLLDSIRSFRHAVLSHASGLQGMLWLVLQETSLSNAPARQKQGSGGDLSFSSLPGSPCGVGGISLVRRASPLVSSVPMASGGPRGRNQINNSSGASVASSSSSSSPSLGSAGSSKTLDPTAAGRKRRRKRLPMPTIDEDGNPMPTIGENGLGGGGSNDIDNPPPLFKRRKRQETKKQVGNDDDGDDLSFSLESPTPPRRTIVSRQLENFSADDISSMASSSTIASAAVAVANDAMVPADETQQKLDHVITRVLESMPEDQTVAAGRQHQQNSCGRKRKSAKSGETNDSFTLWQQSTGLQLPLVALHRIVTGRMEGMERGCLDDDLQAVGNLETEDDDEEELETTEHPQLITNRLLYESGVIPLLSQSMSETAMAITTQLKQPKTTKTGSPCTTFVAYVSHLQKRLSLLRSLVEDACSFNEANRKSICQEGYTVEAGGFLIVNLISVLVALMETSNLFADGGLGEIALEVLRTLNGLAHENKVAAKELEMSLDYSKVVGTKTDTARTSRNNNHCSGLDVVARLLFLAVTAENDKCTDDTIGAVDKLLYDSKVFCLTILGNALQSGASPSLFAEMKVFPKDHNDSENALLFLPWLVKFLGNETRPFRDAVLGSTFGSSPSKHSERRLDQQEDEKLFTAGYGLALVTSLLVGPRRSSGVNYNEKVEKNPQQIVMRELILPELPGDDEEAKLMFVKNTLKAFCNLYHFSVNEDLSLSMLVLGPIKNLLVELDRSMGEKNY